MKKALERVYHYDDKGNVTKRFVIDAKKEDTTVIKKSRGSNEKQKKYLKKKDTLAKYGDKLGGYIHMFYVKNELLFNGLEINRADISRLIYLSTYIDYNNRHENLLIKYGKDSNISTLSKMDIKQLLKLNDKTFREFLDNMEKNNLLFEINKNFYISREYFSKGECEFVNKEYTRIYINTTRFLYENSTSRQHKQLGYIYQLIPYMNYELNILCSNPDEKDFYELNKLNLTQICELLGVSTSTRQNMSKLKNELLKFYIVVDNKKYYFLSYVNVQNGYGVRDYFVVNPQVVWGGAQVDLLKDTIQLCFFKK